MIIEKKEDDIVITEGEFVGQEKIVTSFDFSCGEVEEDTVDYIATGYISNYRKGSSERKLKINIAKNAANIFNQIPYNKMEVLPAKAGLEIRIIESKIDTESLTFNFNDNSVLEHREVSGKSLSPIDSTYSLKSGSFNYFGYSKENKNLIQMAKRINKLGL